MATRITSQAVIDRALGRKRSKYGVRTDVVGKLRRTLDGRVYASAAERDHAAKLELDRKTGRILSWKPQVPFSLRVNGKLICVHIVDFVVVENSGDQRVDEVKGCATEVWRMKRRLLEALNPWIPYNVIPARSVR